MSKEGNSSGEGSSRNPDWFDDDLNVSDEVLASVSDLLGVAEGRQRAELYEKLREIASSYQAEKLIELLRGMPSQQKAAIRLLIRSLQASLRAIDGVSPEYLVQLESMATSGREMARGPDPQRVIRDFRDAAVLFLGEYRPKRGAPTNIALEEALRALLDLVERELGQSVTVDQNKHGIGGPKLRSSPALAMGIFLQAVDSSLADRTIVNMIAKIRMQPEVTESPTIAIFRGDPNAELDCSLLGDRSANN